MPSSSDPGQSGSPAGPGSSVGLEASNGAEAVVAERSQDPDSQPEPPQTAGDRYQIFEQVALERLRRSSDATKAVVFLPLPVRLTALAGLAITTLGVVWAVVARVPVQVYGQGTIVPEGMVLGARARVDGILYYQLSGLGTDRLSLVQKRRNQALQSFWAEAGIQGAPIFSFQRLSGLVGDALAPSEGQRLVMPEAFDVVKATDQLTSVKRLQRSLFVPAHTLVALVDNTQAGEDLDSTFRTASQKLALDRQIAQDRDERAKAYQNVKGLLRLQRDRQKQELAERQALFDRLQALWRQGFVSTTSLLAEQATINQLKSQLLQIDRDSLGTDFSRTDQRQQAGQSRLSALTTRSDLQAALVNYMSKVYVIAPASGFYLVTRVMRNGMRVHAGDELFTFSLKPPTLPTQIPVFVDAATVQQLAEGMKVLVTPKGISRAEYGGIQGRIVEVGRLPLADEGLATFAGGRTLAAAIQRSIASPYLVRVKLELADEAYCQQLLSRRCYRWSTRRVPPFPVRIGTRVDVQINTISRAPIAFVMPMLREAFGFVVDNR